MIGSFFITAFNIILYKPLFNALVLLYQYLPGNDFGIAVIALTIIIKLLFWPLGTLGIKSQKALSELQPKIKEIQEKHKEDKGKQAQETFALYKKARINPFSGCLPLLIQLPILIALYQVFWHGFEPGKMVNLYSFITNPGVISPSFLGILDLSKPNIYLAFLAGILQFFQSRQVMSKDKTIKKEKAAQFGDMLQKQMIYFFPVFTVLILLKLPSAIGLYWVAVTIFSIIQQHFVLKKYKLLNA